MLQYGILAPFSGYLIYQLLIKIKGFNRSVASGIGAYIGINIAALAAAFELGIQPLLLHTVKGISLYFPYTLKQSIPAIMFAHLTIAGIAEALITGLVVFYLQRVDEEHFLYNSHIASVHSRGLKP